MVYRAQEVKVGFMVIVSLVLLIVFVVVVSGLRVRKKTVQYTTHLNYVGGLEVGTPVRLGGVRVGRIAEIVFPGERDQQIELVLEVAEGTPIKADSRAYLTSIGIMGEFYVEIRPGSPEAPLLPPGSEIPSLPSSTFSQLSIQLGQLAVSLDTTMWYINQLLSPRNPAGIPAMLTALNSMIAENADQVRQALMQLKATSNELHNLTATFNATLTENRRALSSALSNLDSTLAQTRSLLASLKQTSESAGQTLRLSSQSLHAVLTNLERSTRNLEAFSHQIQQQPWSLVRKSYPKPRMIPQ